MARLSAGQRRRTSLACLLARRPELWLLDEPHAGLDAEARDLLDGLVRQAVDQGATVVLSSHELDRAEALADRVVVVDGGHVVGPDGSASRRPVRPTPAPVSPTASPTPARVTDGQPTGPVSPTGNPTSSAPTRSPR